jgi:hypothetical protein
LEINEHYHETLEGLKRIEIFPKSFPKPSFGTVYKDKFISVDDRTRAALKYNSGGITFYDADKKYSYLKPTDVIAVDRTEGTEGKKTLLRITNVRVATGKELLELCKDNAPLKQEIENQLSRQVKPVDSVHVIEALMIYDWQIEQNRPVV